METTTPASGDRYVCAVPDVYAKLYAQRLFPGELFTYRAIISVQGTPRACVLPSYVTAINSRSAAIEAGDAWLRSLGWRRDTKVVGV